MAETSTRTTEQSAEEQPVESSRWTLRRVVMTATLALIGLVILLFVAAVVVAIRFPEGAAAAFGYIRNLIVIVLAVQGILIITGLAVLLIQLSRLVNLIRSEVQPITQDTQEAVRTVRRTSEFVGKHSAGPLIQMKAFFSGLWAFCRELFRIRRLLNPPGSERD